MSCIISRTIIGGRTVSSSLMHTSIDHVSLSIKEVYVAAKEIFWESYIIHFDILYYQFKLK